MDGLYENSELAGMDSDVGCDEPDMAGDVEFGYVPGAPLGGGRPMGPGAGRPGMPMGRPAMPNSPQAGISQLQRALAQAGPWPSNGPALAALQAAFDSLRNALKTAYPSGGPNGPVG